jgi:branched-chain amino acid transport system permease protein
VFGNELLLDGDVFWFLLGVLGIFLVLAVLLDRSPLKRRLIAARDNPTVARTAGINVFWLQLMMFVLGSCVAAVAGALIGSWSGVVSNDSFGIDLSVGIFLMVVLGGLGSHWGAVVGAAFYVGVPQVLSGISRYQPIIYGGVLLITIILVPDGITGALQRLVAKVRGDRAGASGAAPYSATAMVKRILGSVPRKDNSDA